MIDVLQPDVVRVQALPGGAWEPGAGRVDLSPRGEALAVGVTAPGGVCRVALRWRTPVPSDPLVLGDAWERSYGELAWHSLVPHRPLPWAVLVHDRSDASTWGAGVQVRGAAWAFWTVDEDGLTLWLDLRSGRAPVRAGTRRLEAAVVHAVGDAGSPFATQGALYARLCPDPRPVRTLVGANNWYYAYGVGFDTEAVLADARTIVELAGDHPVRPFSVVDDGWTPDGTADGRPASAGPWDVGRAPQFADMPSLPARIAATGARPGVWMRPLLTRHQHHPGAVAARDGAWAMDPSHPATLDTVHDDVSRLCGWGFELVKHDFSTYDLLGRWGPAFGADPHGAVTWTAHDASLTTAEAFVRFYETVREAAGDSLVLGCNVVGHLAAGLVDAQRTGDDTSGRTWGRTRRTGVNTLAFRLAQHGRLFCLDADCVPCTPDVPWALARQWLDVVARSGTALFVSIDPASRTPGSDADLSAAIRLALSGGVPGGIEPSDWMVTAIPTLWRGADGETRYDWLEELGADPFEADRGDTVE